MNVQEYKKQVAKPYQSQYDICPICKDEVFFGKTRTQTVRHIYQCLEIQKIREVTKK